MKAGLSACSNGHDPDKKNQIEATVKALGALGIEAESAPHMFVLRDEFSGTDKERAEDLMRFYRDPSCGVIYDVSGGDLANGVLKYLDFDLIRDTDKIFWGYSDLTTIVNAIYTMTGKSSVLYQIKNLTKEYGEMQTKRFKDYLAGNESGLFDLRLIFLQGTGMEGVLVGGNIRCFLKLAGTKYMPDMRGKILLLESLGGGSGQIATLFTQLENMGVFEEVSGVVLGTFTSYEQAELEFSVYDLLKMHIPDNLPVARTREIGHGHDSKAAKIGEFYHFTC